MFFTGQNLKHVFMTDSFLELLIFFLSTLIPLLGLNELGEKSQATIILRKFANKPLSNSHQLIVFGKCFSLVKI